VGRRGKERDQRVVEGNLHPSARAVRKPARRRNAPPQEFDREARKMKKPWRRGKRGLIQNPFETLPTLKMYFVESGQTSETMSNREKI